MGKFSEPISKCPSSNMIFLGMCDKKVNSLCTEHCNGDKTAPYTSFDGRKASGDFSKNEKDSAIEHSENNSKAIVSSVPDIQINDVYEKEKERAGNCDTLTLSSSCPAESDISCREPAWEPQDDVYSSERVLDKPGEPHALDGLPAQHYVNPSMNTTSSSTLVDEIPVELGSSARLSKVLENISLPLLYIPTTKQLVASRQEGAKDDLLLSKESTPTDDELSKLAGQLSPMSFNSSVGESAHASTTLIPKAHSTGEFDLPGRLADLDHITVHSVDSLPCSSHLFEASSSTFCDNSSLSSVSTNTDFSISALSMAGEEAHPELHSLSRPDEGLFMEINLHTHNSFDLGAPNSSSSADNGSVHLGDSDQGQGAKKKPQVFSGLINLFSKKTKEESPPGWKLFGKVPPKATPHRNPEEITSEFQARQRKAAAKASGPAKRHDTEVMSTTALILENRPTNLPSKTREEAEKHRQQYEEMIEAAKKKEQKDMKLKKKHLQQQRKVEDKLMSAAQMWNTEILPNWESMRSSKKARGLWWMGLPPNIRGRVWQLAIGNDLNITHDLYDICHERAVDRVKLMQAESSLSSSSSDVALTQMAGSSITSNKESSVKVIKLDVSRTFPQLCIFQKGGPYFELLHSLLGAYACYRPDVGYVQGMSFIAAILLLNMDVADAFVCFANLLNRPCQMAFFRMDEHMMTSYYSAFEEFFKENLPKLFDHFKLYSVTPNLYLMEWVFLLYSKSLPLDVACRVWDVFCRDGEEFLFRTAIGILKLYECVLLQMDFIHMAQYLTKLPEDICADQLFKMVDSVCMSLDKKGFNSVHSYHRDNVDPSSHSSYS